MDIGNVKQGGQITQCRAYTTNNKLDIIPDSESSHCHCSDVDEIPKVFPKYQRRAVTLTDSTTTSTDDPKKTIPCPGFFHKVMENAKSILSMRCTNIHPDDPINEEPTKDVGDSCICEADDRPWNSANSNSRGMEFYSAPTATSSDLCTCDEESTKNDTSADSYSYSVTCSCKNTDDNNADNDGQTPNNFPTGESDGTYADSRINSSTYSTTKHEEVEETCRSYDCHTTRPLLSDKLVQSKIQHHDTSCECTRTVPVHSTGTKMYNVDRTLGQKPHEFQSHSDATCECFPEMHSTGTKNYQIDSLAGVQAKTNNLRDNSCECFVQMHSTGTFNYPPDRLLAPPVTETQIFDSRYIKPLATSSPKCSNQTCNQLLSKSATGTAYPQTFTSTTTKSAYQMCPSSLPASTLRPAGERYPQTVSASNQKGTNQKLPQVLEVSTLKCEVQTCPQPLQPLKTKDASEMYSSNQAASTLSGANHTPQQHLTKSISKGVKQPSTIQCANQTCPQSMATLTSRPPGQIYSPATAASIVKSGYQTCPQSMVASSYSQPLAASTKHTDKTCAQPGSTSLETSIAIDAPLAASTPKSTNQIGLQPPASSTTHQNGNNTRDIDFNTYLESLKNTDTYAMEPSYCDEQTCSFYNLAKSSTAPNVSHGVQAEKSTSNMGTTPSGRKLRSRSSLRDQNDQCAFVGSPIIKPINCTTGMGDSKGTCSCNLPTTNNSKSSQIFNLLNDMATQEKEMKDQIRSIMEKEKNYESLLKCFENTMNQSKNCCCCSCSRGQSEKTMNFDRISKELKLENCMLKSQVMELKLDLKHCLEKVEGPMKQQLETEKCKCMQLQDELTAASQNMAINQDVYLREMNSLKMQLCMACSNMTELSTMNQRLKNELDGLDSMCIKLEDDLVKQKLSEAETIKRLKRRLPSNCQKFQPTQPKIDVNQSTLAAKDQKSTASSPSKAFEEGSSEDTLCSDSNLHSIARKLSKTLKESAPCEECSKLPTELTEAAKCIKNLTDMVESRKINKYKMDLIKDCVCQSPPQTQEMFCQCFGLRDVAAGTSKTATYVGQPQDKAKGEIPTKTLFSVPPNVFMNDTTSSHANVQYSAVQAPIPTKPTAEMTASMYFSAQIIDNQSEGTTNAVGETCAPIGKPCSIFQIPDNMAQQSSEKTKFAENAVNCTLIGPPSSNPTDMGIEKGDIELPQKDLAPATLSAKQSKSRASDRAALEPTVCMDSIYFDETKEIIQVSGDLPVSTNEGTTICIDSIIHISIDNSSQICKSDRPVDTIQTDRPDSSVSPSKPKSASSISQTSKKPETVVSEKLLNNQQYEDMPSVQSKTSAEIQKHEQKDIISVEQVSEIQKKSPDVASTSADDRFGKPPEGSEIKKPEQTIASYKTMPADVMNESKQTSNILPNDETIPAPVLSQKPSHSPCPQSCYIDGKPCERGQESTINYRLEKGIDSSRLDSYDVARYVSDVLVENVVQEDESLAEKGDPMAKETNKANDIKTEGKGEDKDVSDNVEKDKDISQRVSFADKDPIRVHEEDKDEEDQSRSQTSNIASKSSKASTRSDREASPPSRPSALSKTISNTSDHISDNDTSNKIEPLQPELKEGNSTATKPAIYEEKSGNFPFDIETTGIVLTEPPSGLILTTTITNSGNLEIITEGPAGIIETELTYREDGVIEVVTQITELTDDEKSAALGDATEYLSKTVDTTPVSAKDKTISDEAKSEFEQQRKELLKKALEKDSMLSGASGLTDIHTSDSQNKGQLPSSQISSQYGGETSSYFDKTDSSGRTPKTDGFTKTPATSKHDATTADATESRKSVQQTSDISSVSAGVTPDTPGVGAQQTSEISAVSTGITPDVTGVGTQQTSAISAVSAGVTPDVTGVGTQQTSAISAVSAGVTPDITGVGTQQTSAISAVSAGVTRDLPSDSIQQTSAVSAVSTGVTPDDTRTAESSTQQKISTANAEVSPAATESGIQQTSAISTAETEVTPDGKGASVQQTSAVSTAETGAMSGEKDTDVQQTSAVSTAETEVTPDGKGKSVQQTSVVSTAETEAMSSEKDTGVRQTSAVSPAETPAPAASKDLQKSTNGSSVCGEVMDEVLMKIGESDFVIVEKESEKIASGVTDDQRSVLAEERGNQYNVQDTPPSQISAANQHSEQSVESQKADIACQSNIPIEQSCQCCECKDIGVSTSKDTETTTDHKMTGERSPKAVQKDSQASSFHTVGDGVSFPKFTDYTDETADRAVAAPSNGKTHGGTTDEISTINEESEGKSSEQQDPTKTPSEKEDTDQFESAMEFGSKEAGVMKDTGDSITESFTQQTDKISQDRSAGSAKIRDGFQGLTADAASLPRTTSKATDYDPKTPILSQEKRDSKQKTPSKETTEPKAKGSSEVPDSVSKLSDKVMPPFNDSSENRKARKKRSSKLSDFRCECQGVCQCVVCSPEILIKRKEETGSTAPPISSQYKLCCCNISSSTTRQATSSLGQTQNVYLQTQQIQSPTTTTNNEPNKCALCSLCPPDREQGSSNTEAFLKCTNLDSPQCLSRERERTNIDDVFSDVVDPGGKTQKKRGCRANIYAQTVQLGCTIDCPKSEECLQLCLNRTPTPPVAHPSNCECVDCLCLPKIKELAQTVEFPVVHDEKQIYQVHSIKCTCANTKKSKIPIATNARTIPPAPKHPPSCDCELCECSPCADPNKRPKQPESDTVDLSKLCDCKECKCEVCFDKFPNNNADCVDPNKVGSKKPKDKKCCCTDDCICEVCLVEELQRKLEEVSKQLNEQVSRMGKVPSKISAKPSGKTSPLSKMSEKPSKEVSQKPSKEVSQKSSKQVSQKSSKMSKQPSLMSHQRDCNCYECKCPSKPAMSKTPSKISKTPSKSEDPSTIPEEPTTDPEEPTPTTQEPATVTEEPATTPEESVTTPEEPVTTPEEPVTTPEEPVTTPEEPVTAPEEPVTAPEEPVTAPEDLAAVPEEPPVTPEESQPVAETSPLETIPDHPKDCNCYECFCIKPSAQVPGVPSEMSKKSVQLPSEDKPQPDGGVSAKPSAMSEKQSEVLQSKVSAGSVKPDIPAEPSAIPACDCDKCVCCPCLDPNQVKTSRAMGGDQIPATASQNLPIPTVPCDCTECICSPCADPRKRKGRTAPLSANVSSADRPPHPEGCICDACLCGEDGEIEDGTPGLGPQIDQKMSQVASGLGGPQVGQKMSKVASGDSPTEPCTCEVCKCPGKELSSQPIASAKPSSTSKSRADDAPREPCTCEVCQCPGKDLEVHQPIASKLPSSTSKSGPGVMEAGVGTKDNKEVHPMGCECTTCECEELIQPTTTAQPPISAHASKATHPKDCTCIECKCENAAQTPSIMPITADKETHPADCMCDKCLCDQGEKHEKGCRCLECKCIECYMKGDAATHSMVCKCGECLCQECPHEKAVITDAPGVPAGDQISAKQSSGGQTSAKQSAVGPTSAVASVGAPPNSTASQMERNVSFKSPGGGVGDIEACACGNCQCTECYFKTERFKPVKECKCSPCLCKSCEFQPETITAVESFRSAVSVEEKRINPDQSCHCIDCKCDCCIKRAPSGDRAISAVASRGISANNSIRSQGERRGDKEVIAKASVRDQACLCTTCSCDKHPLGLALPPTQAAAPASGQALATSVAPAQALSPAVATKGSTGAQGQTVTEINSKQIADEERNQAIQEPITQDIKHSEKCKCDNCTCTACFTESGVVQQLVDAEQHCNCPECLCKECSFQNQQPIASAKPSENRSMAKTESRVGEPSASAKTSEMKSVAVTESSHGQPPASAKPSDMRSLRSTAVTESSHGQDMDPPPFEIPVRKPCECKTCSCVICTDKHQIPSRMDTKESRLIFAADNTRPVDYNNINNMFEVPISIGCNCPICRCIVCKEDIMNMTSRTAAGPQSASAIQPIQSAVSTSKRPMSAPTGSRSRPPSPVHCNCPTCICPGGASEQPIREETLVSGKPSTISGKQSRTSERTGEYSHPNQCACNICNCTEEITKLIYGKLVSNMTGQLAPVISAKPSAKSVQIAASQKSSHASGKPSQISEKPGNMSGTGSHISGKSSRESGRVAPDNSRVSGTTSQVSAQPSRVSGKSSGSASQQATAKESQVIGQVSYASAPVSGKPSGQASVTSGKSNTHAEIDSAPFTDDYSTCCPCVHQQPTNTNSSVNCLCACHGKQALEINAGEARSNISAKPSNPMSMRSGRNETQPSNAASATTGASAPAAASIHTVSVHTTSVRGVPGGPSVDAATVQIASMHVTPGDPSPIKPAGVVSAGGQLESIDISKLDNSTLLNKIESGRRENCECREQIKEIKRALTKIKCACNEAEIKASRNKPFVKQASAFGQTMSGLKLALNNLQEKCKAKDKMIDAMTGELKLRTSSNTLNKILNTSMPDVLDYDKAKKVISVESSRDDPVPTNVLYSLNEDREMKITDFDSKMYKAISSEKKRTRPRSSRICRCGKSHRDRDLTRVDLSGFDIIDIRRITHDSIIVKWKPPKSNLICGYDIFVNGVYKSKVMSGGRTSAMIHSLDLSATIEITIYAVTKCGRCENPAIAIYEIKPNQ